MNSATMQQTWADSETLNAVRPEVRKILESSQGFAKLSPEEQRQLAQTMVKVSAYMANPDGLAAQELSPKGGILATAQADSAEAVRKRLAKDPGFAGEDFQAGAVKQGVQQFGELVKKVDFPMFVSGLIQNVFQAIVDSSIQQMRAYGELLANVAKTVDEFARDNITENNARDWLSQRFPDMLDLDTNAMSVGFAEGDTEPPPSPHIIVREDQENPEAALTRISEELQLAKPVTNLSDEAEEQRLVQAARLQIARSRQQLLASMVMLGINRIVVTDGLIHAKVVFDMRASDQARRVARASMYDRTQQSSSSMSLWSAGFFVGAAGGVNTSSSDHVATVQSSVDETSESKAEVKAKLTGEVRVNFKSDFMPMEKMATPEMIAAIQGNATPPAKRLEGS